MADLDHRLVPFIVAICLVSLRVEPPSPQASHGGKNALRSDLTRRPQQPSVVAAEQRTLSRLQ
jgi:hypothetical protein